VQAGAWPSYRFYRRVDALRGFAETFRGSPRLTALVDAAGDAVGLVAWLMDGVERRVHPGLPFVLDDEVDERGWDQLVDALASAVEASDDPDAMLSWQRVTIRRLRWHHPARPGEQALEPVPQESFRRATEWPG
jgi:hypothetical protein